MVRRTLYVDADTQKTILDLDNDIGCVVGSNVSIRELEYRVDVHLVFPEDNVVYYYIKLLQD